jgi:SAM-dependent methyltransferase
MTDTPESAPRPRLPIPSVEVLPLEPPFGPEVMRDLGLRGIHPGSGVRFRKGWLNTDILCLWDKHDHATEHARISHVADREGETYYYLQHDSPQPYPCPDGTFEWGFSEHFLEHLTPSDAIGWLVEMRRVLRPGGLMRISTPNLETYMRGYLDPEGRFFAEHRKRLEQMHAIGPKAPTTRAWMVNQIFFKWGHRWVYDFEEIRDVAVRAGFPADQVVEYGFQEGSVEEVAQLDLPVRNDESIYVELRSASERTIAS